MAPTYCAGDLLVVQRKAARNPQRGLAVVFYGERGDLVLKRVVATAGERVRTDSDQLVIGGHTLDEPYLCPVPRKELSAEQHLLANVREIIVQPDEVFLMGDNRPQSTDSRDFGAVSTGRIVGEIVATWSHGSESSNCKCEGNNSSLR